MNTLSRVLVLACLALTLTACGDGDDSDDKPDAAAATTHACRSYVLLGGADDQRIATELQQALDGVGPGYNLEDVQARLAAVRAGAAKAGLTEDLPRKDYRLFADVVKQAIALSSTLQDSDDPLRQAAVSSYKGAVASVGDRCD